MTVDELIEALQESKAFGTGGNQILVRDGDDWGEFRPDWVMVSMAESCLIIDLGGVKFAEQGKGAYIDGGR